MSNGEERRKILEMVADGKLSITEAAALLGEGSSKAGAVGDAAANVTGEPAEKSIMSERSNKEPGHGPNWLHIRVADLKSGRNKVAVNIPLRLLDIGAELGRAHVPELAQFDWSLLNSALSEGEGRALVDIRDEEDGEHVQIYVD